MDLVEAQLAETKTKLTEIKAERKQADARVDELRTQLREAKKQRLMVSHKYLDVSQEELQLLKRKRDNGEAVYSAMRAFRDARLTPAGQPTLETTRQALVDLLPRQTATVQGHIQVLLD